MIILQDYGYISFMVMAQILCYGYNKSDSFLLSAEFVNFCDSICLIAENLKSSMRTGT